MTWIDRVDQHVHLNEQAPTSRLIGSTRTSQQLNPNGPAPRLAATSRGTCVLQRLIPCAPQRSLQFPRLQPSPHPVTSFRALDLGTQDSDTLGVLLLRPIQSLLCLVDGPLPARLLLLLGCLLPSLLALLALSLALVRLRGNPVVGLLALGSPALGTTFCVRRPQGFSVVRRAPEPSAGSHGPFEDDAWLSHGCGDNVRISALHCRASWKRLLSAPHASRAAFIDGAAMDCSKKPSDVWYVSSFLAISPFTLEIFVQLDALAMS